MKSDGLCRDAPWSVAKGPESYEKQYDACHLGSTAPYLGSILGSRTGYELSGGGVSNSSISAHSVGPTSGTGRSPWTRAVNALRELKYSGTRILKMITRPYIYRPHSRLKFSGGGLYAAKFRSYLKIGCPTDNFVPSAPIYRNINTRVNAATIRTRSRPTECADLVTDEWWIAHKFRRRPIFMSLHVVGLQYYTCSFRPYMYVNVHGFL